ncbi:MAG: hypothetical protein WEE89_08740 [Gemmatimonadota bacterium]
MITAKDPVTPQESERAFLAFLAALYIRGIEELDDSGDVLHGSFDHALGVLKGDEQLSKAFARYRMGGFSGRIDALDQALIRAEQFGWVQFPNPSYQRMAIAMSPADAESILSSFGKQRATIESAATAFEEHFHASW